MVLDCVFRCLSSGDHDVCLPNDFSDGMLLRCQHTYHSHYFLPLDYCQSSVCLV